MIIQSSILDNKVYSNLGAADCKTASALRFISTRKLTEVKVTVDIIIIFQSDRWIVYELDGTLFQVGEHTYQILDSSDNVLENGILIVNDDTKTAIPEFNPALSGDKGEFTES